MCIYIYITYGLLSPKNNKKPFDRSDSNTPSKKKKEIGCFTGRPFMNYHTLETAADDFLASQA